MPQGETLTEGWADERWRKRKRARGGRGKKKKERRRKIDIWGHDKPPVWEASRTLGLSRYMSQ